MQVAHRGFYIFKVDATNLVDPYDRGVSTLPEVYEVAMNSQLSTPLDDTTSITVGGAHYTLYGSCTGFAVQHRTAFE